MNKHPEVLVGHIIDSVRAIQRYLPDTKQDFLKNPEKQDAIIRRFEIIGEASSRLADDFRGQYPELPWGKVVGLRNILIHEYFNVDVESIWDLLQGDFKVFKDEVNQIAKAIGMDERA